MTRQQKFLGNWLGRKAQNKTPKTEDTIEIDISDIEFGDQDVGWGGITRPGNHPQLSGEEFTEEEGMEDEWENSDDDDDDHGGHMMPLPRLF